MNKQLKILSIICSSLVTLVAYQNCSNNMSPLNLDSQSSASSYSASEIESAAMGVIQNNCTKCHNGNFAGGGIDYISDVAQLKYYRVVLPGEAAVSPFYTVLTSNQDHMSLLQQAQLDLIFNWIQTGMVATGPGVAPVKVPLGPSFNSISKNILQLKCTGCHGVNGIPRGTLDYRTYASFKNSGVFTPNNPAASLIVIAVGPNPKPGLDMPRGATMRLSPDEVKAISDWIAAGALDN